MARSTPIIRDTELLLNQDGHQMSILVGSEQWFQWLREESSTTFAFHALGGAYTARKERVGNGRGGWYWKAYRTYQGKLYRAYLGKTEDLVLSRLYEVERLLSSKASEIEERIDASQAQADNQGLTTPLLQTKLHPPQLPMMLVGRTRLLKRLESWSAYKVTLLLAPAGFGKTTLVNQWLATSFSEVMRTATTAWVSLDDGDNDPLRFWRSVITACLSLVGQEQQSSVQSALAMLSPKLSPHFDLSPIETALTRLLNDLSMSTEDRLLVLDDYHVLTNSQIHASFSFFVEHLPGSMHVLLLSRSEPSLPLLRWRARGDLYELHASELRFSLEETKVFLNLALPIPLSEAALARLDEYLEGWVAGLRLLSLTLARWHTSQAIEQALLAVSQYADLSSPHRPLLEYLVTEILETQPESIQQFLLQTSVLGRLCGSLCDAVTRSEQSADRLEDVKRAGLFLEALEGLGGWYRYHALFAEAMRREASKRMGDEEIRELSRRASYWYEQERLFPEAIESALLANDMDRVAFLIEELNALREFNEPSTTLRWLEQLPEEILRPRPLLCLLFATELRFPIELRLARTAIPISDLLPLSRMVASRVETLLQMAEEGWRKSGELIWIGTIFATRLLISVVDQDPFTRVVQYARQGLTYLELGTSDYRIRMYCSTCLLYMGMEELRLGHLREARRLILQAQEENVSLNRFLTIGILSVSGKMHLQRGELQQAKIQYQQALEGARILNDLEMSVDMLLELAWLAFEWNDLEDVEQLTQEAYDLSARISPPRQEFFERTELQFALLLYARGESATLRQLTARRSQVRRGWTPESYWLFERTRDWQGRLLIAAGATQALRASLSVSEPDIESVSMTEYLVEQILLGRAMLAERDEKSALQHFARLLRVALKHDHRYVALEIQLLIALAYESCQQAEKARYWLKKTLSLAFQESLVRLFLNEGKPVVLLLRSLLPDLASEPTLYAYAQILLQGAPQRAKIMQQALVQTTNGLSIEPLSAQEERVWHLLASGWSNQDIARELIISVNTVKYHIKHLYQKLGVSNRLQASELARRLHTG